MAVDLRRAGGEPGAPPVLLIHGFGADRLGWAGTLPALAVRYAVWTAELPGHGRATPSEGDVAAAAMAAELQEALSEEWMHIVAHSLGGAVAAHLAARAPARVGRCVLLAPAGFGAGLPDGDFLDGFARLQDPETALALLRRLVVRERLVTPQMADYVLAHLERPGIRAALARIAAAIPRAAPAPLPPEALVIWGAEDTIAPPDTGWLAGLGDRALMLPGTGHLPHLEAATKVNCAILEYLDG